MSWQSKSHVYYRLLLDDYSAGDVRAADDVEARGERELVARGEGYEAAGDVVDVLVEAIGPGEGD